MPNVRFKILAIVFWSPIAIGLALAADYLNVQIGGVTGAFAAFGVFAAAVFGAIGFWWLIRRVIARTPASQLKLVGVDPSPEAMQKRIVARLLSEAPSVGLPVDLGREIFVADILRGFRLEEPITVEQEQHWNNVTSTFETALTVKIREAGTAALGRLGKLGDAAFEKECERQVEACLR